MLKAAHSAIPTKSKQSVKSKMIARKINIVMFYLCYAISSILSAKQSQQSKVMTVNGPSQKCSISEFTCANNNCISAAQFCDNNDDCGDASDEPRFCTSEWTYTQLKVFFFIKTTAAVHSALFSWCFFVVTFASSHENLLKHPQT